MSWRNADDLLRDLNNEDDWTDEECDLELLMSEPTRVEGIPGGGLWQDENEVWHRRTQKAAGSSYPTREWYNRTARHYTSNK